MATKNNITRYLLENRATLGEVPFNEVDSLVLSTIAYFYLEHGPLAQAKPGELVPLPVALCGISHKDLFGRSWLTALGGAEFLSALLQSPRFMELLVSDHCHEFSGSDKVQFAAMTFWLPGGTAYVAFRGTDSSIAGWQEDFNLSFMEEVPSQKLAREYLERIASRLPKRIFTGGHSKGGNLCEYAALTCSVDAYLLIERIYNHDGPAFAFPPSPRIETDNYKEKLNKTVPGSSIIGMIMEERTDHDIVKSTGALILQHATTHWIVEDGSFVILDELNPEAASIDKALIEWTEINDAQQREILVEALFQVVHATNVESWGDLKTDPMKSAKAALKAANELPPEISGALVQLGKHLFVSMAKSQMKRKDQEVPENPAEEEMLLLPSFEELADTL